MDTERLLRMLADGEYHSSETLLRAFDEQGAAKRLAEWGLGAERSSELGLRLERRLDLIDADALEARLPNDVRAMIDRLALFIELDSTNRHLLEAPSPPPGKLAVCLAEYQHAGRGRRGRRWIAPLGAGLCLSASWRLAAGGGPMLGGLSLVVGISARRAIAATCGVDVQLKWPNDLVWHERKLGGVLLETSSRAGVRHVVAGVGLNVSFPTQGLSDVSDWRAGAVDLATVTEGRPPPREALAAALVAEIAAAFRDYDRAGFAEHRAEWRRADCLRGRRVRVHAGEPLEGTALDVDADGALLIQTDEGERRRIVSGEVTVRALP